MSELKRSGRGKIWSIATIALMAGSIGFASQLAAPRHAEAAYPLTTMGMAGDIEEAQERATSIAWRLGDLVKASADQKIRLVNIAKDAAKDVFPVRQELRDLRAQSLDLLRQPTINRDEFQKNRDQMVGKIDAISNRITQAYISSLEVLTPDQRKNLAEDISFLMRHRGALRTSMRDFWDSMGEDDMYMVE